MAGYAPVFRAILQSTVWDEAPHVKVVWLTMLLLCDKTGFVEATIPGLARAAVVTREQCVEAIERLSSPDPDSKTKAEGGRRIIKVDDGWQLVNHQKYKDKVGLSSKAARERVQNHRKRKKESKKKSGDEIPEKSEKNNQANTGTLDTCNAGNGFPIGIGLGIGIDSPSQISSGYSENSQRAESEQAPEQATESRMVDEPTPVPKRPKRPDPTRRSFEPPKDVEVLMFETWREAAEKPGATLDDYGKQFFGILHDQGVTVDQVRMATLGAKNDAWARSTHMSPNAILKTATQREKFIAMYKNPEMAKLAQNRSGPKIDKHGEGCGSGPQPNDPNNRIVPNTIEFSPEELASAQDS